MEKSTKTSVSFRVAEVKLTYHSKVKASERLKITCAEDSREVLLKSWGPGKLEFIEQFKLILLNRANQLLCIYEVSTGGIAGTVADPKLIFVAALKA